MVDNVLYNVLMTIRTRRHRHERIANRQLKARLETLASSEGFAPNRPRTSYLVSAPSKERGQLGYHHYRSNYDVYARFTASINIARVIVKAMLIHLVLIKVLRLLLRRHRQLLI